MLQLANFVNLIHDSVPFLIVGQCSPGAKESLARLLGRHWNHLNLNLDFLAQSHAEVLVKCDGPATDFAVQRFGHCVSF